jgi:hypothetical protein
LKEIVPIGHLKRAPEQGRIRYGMRVKGIPRSILKFRFTSSDAEAMHQIQQLYGGEVLAWEKGKYEILTNAAEIPIILPPDPLSQAYEMWQGSGCIRRCDGITCEIPIKTPDGSDLTEVPCVCDANQKLECKPTTRLNVVLPHVRFGGVWRLDCKGWFGGQELPAMVETILALQGKGMSHAFLALEQRDKPGKKFVVPVLRHGNTPMEMLAHGNQQQAAVLGSGSPVPTPELGVGK